MSIRSALGLAGIAGVLPLNPRIAFQALLALWLLCGVVAAQAAIPGTQRQALIDLYNATGGPGWTNNTGWNGPVGTECTWFGVTCEGDNVVGINLNSNQLTGALPALSGLPNLRIFIVDSNRLTGPMPTLTGLTNLLIFSADKNQLTGSIPSLAGLASLLFFSVNENQLSGSIPSLSGLTSLQQFRVRSNSLSGNIPALTGLTNLGIFSLMGIS